MPVDSESIKKVLRYRWIIFVILGTAYFLGMFHRVSPGVMAKAFMDTFGIGASEIGILGGSYFYPYALAQIPAGVLSDTWGTRKTITAFLSVAGLGALFTGIGASWSMVVVGRVLIGFGVGFVYIPILRSIFNWFRIGERATANGILVSVGNIGALTAAGPLAIANESLGWHSVFYMLAGLTALLCVFVYAIVRNQPDEMGWPNLREIEEYEGKDFSDEPPLKRMSVRDSIVKVFKGKSFILVAVWGFMSYGVFMTYQGLWGGAYFEDALGWTREDYGFLLSMIAIGMILGCPFWGWIADKVLRSRKRVLIIGTAGMAIVWSGLWGAIGSSNRILYTGLNFLFGFFAGNFPNGFVQIAELYPREIAGTASACLNVFFFIGGAVTMQLVSSIIGSYGKVAGAYPVAAYSTGWLFMALIMVTSSVCTFFMPERKIAKTLAS
nr:MFS transporter [Desulfobacterales bacterium]